MGSASSASSMRGYRLWIPSTRDERKPSALVMMLNGCGQNPKELAATCGMKAIAERITSLSSIQSRLRN